MTDREKTIRRIMMRIQRYCNGEISIDELAGLEDADGDGMLDLKITPNELNAVLAVFSSEKESKPSKPSGTNFKITPDEYRALTLKEQQDLYDKYPDMIRALLDPNNAQSIKGEITKSRFFKLPQNQQEYIFEKEPDLIRALLDGRISYIDGEVLE